MSEAGIPCVELEKELPGRIELSRTKLLLSLTTHSGYCYVISPAALLFWL